MIWRALMLCASEAVHCVSLMVALQQYNSHTPAYKQSYEHTTTIIVHMNITAYNIAIIIIMYIFTYMYLY